MRYGLTYMCFDQRFHCFYTGFVINVILNKDDFGGLLVSILVCYCLIPVYALGLRLPNGSQRVLRLVPRVNWDGLRFSCETDDI